MACDTDTDSLQESERAPDRARARRHPIPTSRAGATGLCLLAVLAACDPGTSGGSGGTPVATANTDQGRAEALLRPETPLPTRAETVALADAVAVASAKSGASPEGAGLALLAADLRARLWRIDRAAADAHEAFELYRAASAAYGPTEAGCRTSLRAAHFAGEVAGDAGATYRALFIAERVEAARGAPASCVDAIRVARAAAIAFRPDGEKLAALEKDAEIAVAAARCARRSSPWRALPAPRRPPAPPPAPRPPRMAPGPS